VPTWILSVLSPFTHAVAAVLATAHHALVAAGADPASGLTWVAALVALVVVVRLALIPLVVRQVRLTHATARAQPALDAISTAYAGRTDPESLRRRLEETRAVQAEHGVGAFASLPLLLQVPVLLALYRVLADLGTGVAVPGAGAELSSSAHAARLAGVSLGTNLVHAPGGSGAAVIATVVLATALVSYLTSRYLVRVNLTPAATEGPMALVTRFVPTATVVGILVSGTTLPLGVLLYWLIGALWTGGQQAAVNRWAPTPGSPAHRSRVGAT